jgi:hypothetical protein
MFEFPFFPFFSGSRQIRGPRKTSPENSGGNVFFFEGNKQNIEIFVNVGTDLGSLGDLVAEDLTLDVAEIRVQRNWLQNAKKSKKREFMV